MKRLMKVFNVMVLGIFLMQPLGGPGLYYVLASSDDTDITIVQEESESNDVEEDKEVIESVGDDEVDDNTDNDKSVEEESNDKSEETDDSTEEDSEESEDNVDVSDGVGESEENEDFELNNTGQNVDEEVEEEVKEEVDTDENVEDNLVPSNTNSGSDNQDEESDKDSISTVEEGNSIDSNNDNDNLIEDKENKKDERQCLDEWVEKNGRYTRCVEENVEYELDLNKKDDVDGLKIKFTDIDMDANEDNPREITIKEVKLTDKQVVKLNALGDTAWDITSTMKKGTFEFELIIPSSNQSIEEGIEVVYAEDEKDLDDIKKIEKVNGKDVNVNKGNVKVENLDHFTVFIITTHENDTFSTSKSTYEQGETVFIKATGLFVSRWYRIDVYEPDGTKHSVFGCGKGNTQLKAEYDLGSEALLGPEWKAEIMKYGTKSNCLSSQDILGQTSVQFEVIKSVNYEQTKICHAVNGSEFVEEVPATIEELMRHVGLDHGIGRDIIPPIPGLLSDGQNWNKVGQEIWENKCNTFGSITIIKDAKPDSSQKFDFTVDPPYCTDSFTLIDDGTYKYNKKRFLSLVSGTYTITEKDVPEWALTDISCNGKDVSMDLNNRSASIDLGWGEDVTCTFTNEKNSTLTLVKKVKQSYGGTHLATAWKLFADGPTPISGVTGSDSITNVNVGSGVYKLSELGPKGYNANKWNCGDKEVVHGAIELDGGDNVTCTITNNDMPSDLTVCKFNDLAGDGQYDGDEMLLGGWEMTLRDSAGNIIGQQTTQQMNITKCVARPGCVTFRGLSAGNYTVTESQQSGWINTNTTNLTQPVTLELDDSQTIYFGNQQLGTIIVHKDVVGPSGEDITDTTNNFTVTLDGSDPKTFTDGETVTYNGIVAGDEKNPKVYTIDESSIPIGYKLDNIIPDSDGNLSGAQITVSPGKTTDVYVTNSKTAGDLQLCKFEDNNGDGIKNNNEKYIEWEVGAVGQDAVKRGDDGCYTWSGLPMGDYEVFEVEKSGWEMTTNNNHSTVAVHRGDKTLVEFGNYKRGSITIEKRTVPDGSEQEFDFTGAIAGTIADGETISADIVLGQYSVAETKVDGWNLTSIECDDDNSVGDINTGTVIFNVEAREDVKCVFTNSEQPTLTLEKVVISDSGGQATQNNFQAQINSSDVAWDEVIKLNPGTYTASEEVLAGGEGHTASLWSGDCAGSGVVTLNYGDHKRCTITNDDDPSSISGYKWNDLNHNSLWDIGEDPIAGVTINITDNDTFNAQTVTDAIGYYEFEVDAYRTYTISEDVNSLYGNWLQTFPSGNGEHVINIIALGTNRAGVDFGNVERGSIYGHKWHDRNMNGIKDVDEELLSGWTIFLDENANGMLDEGERSAPTSNEPGHEGEYLFDDLYFGEYHVCEVLQTGWQQTYPIDPNCHTVTVSGDRDMCSYDNNCEIDRSRDSQWDCDCEYDCGCDWDCDCGCDEYDFGNVKLGEVIVTKWNDANGDGMFDDGEDVLSDWDVNLKEKNGVVSGYDQTQTTGTNGTTTFTNLKPTIESQYMLNEAQKEGWRQTHIYCDGEQEVMASSDGLDFPETIGWKFTTIADVVEGNPENESVQFELDAGETKRCYIGNQIITPDLTVTKTNNEYANGPDKPNDIVRYTLTVTADAEGGLVKDAKLIDLPPEQFKYVSGTATASSSLGGAHDGTLELSHEYAASPGVWSLGNMVPGEVITLAYDARIGENAQTGVYPDIAYANGKDLLGTSIMATSEGSGFVVNDGIVNDTFVGTQIEIIAEDEIPAVVNVEVDEDVEKIKKKKDVIVTLPVTGAEENWIKFAAIAFVVGILLLLGGGLMRMRRGKLDVNVGILFIAMGIVFAGAGNVFAASGDVVVRADEPVKTSNTTFSFGYVALDIQSRGVDVTCLVQKPSSSTFETFKTISHGGAGNSGDCGISSEVLSEQGIYKLKVKAIADSDVSESETYEVAYNTTTPDKPKWIEKDKKGDCRYDVKFKTANDGQTAYVELYHSRDREFNVDEDSKWATVIVGPNEKMTVTDYLDETSVCNKKHWYAVRAFDEAGNASSVRVEEEEVEETKTVENIIKVKETTSYTDTTTSSDGIEAGAEEIKQNNVDVELEKEVGAEANDEGEVAGETVGESLWNRAKDNWIGIFIITLGMIGGVYLARKRRSQV